MLCLALLPFLVGSQSLVSVAAALTILEAARFVLREGITNFSLQSQPHLVLLRPQFYKKKLKRLLINWSLLWLQSQQCYRRDFAAVIAGDPGLLDPVTFLENMGHYLVCDHGTPASWDDNGRRAMMFVRTKVSPATTQLLNLIKGKGAPVATDVQA